MRPDRSVMHSPRLTNRNGVETRMAPPNTASGTVQSPIVPSAMSGFAFQEADPSVERIAREDEDEDDSLQYVDGSIGQAEPALQQPAARTYPAQENGNGNNGKRILPGEEGNENTGEAVTGGKIGIGSALHRGDFDHSGQSRASTCEEADGHDQLADAEADNLSGANVAAGKARGKTEHGVIEQNVRRDGCDDAEHQSPMHVGAGDRTHHIGRADLARRRFVEAGRIAHRALDQMVEDRQRDIDEQQARYRFIDAAILTKSAGEHDPEPAGDHAS